MVIFVSFPRLAAAVCTWEKTNMASGSAATGSTRLRSTNNSVASLDEQSALLASVFKEKEKLLKPKDKKQLKVKRKKKAAETVTSADAQDEVDTDMADGFSQIDSQDDSSYTWAQAERETEQQAHLSPNYPEDFDDQVSQDLDLQPHVADHSMSEDDDQVSDLVSEAPALQQKKETPREIAVLPEIKAQGLGADMLKEHLSKVKECDKVSSKISEPVAAGIDKFLRDSWYTSEMEKLAKQYPRVHNVEGLKVPKLDVEVFQLLEQGVRNTDQSFQNKGRRGNVHCLLRSIMISRLSKMIQIWQLLCYQMLCDSVG